MRSRQINWRLLLHLLLPRDPSVPIQPQCREHVEHDKGPHDSEIAPSGRILRAEPCEVDVRISSGAILAIGRGIVVGEVTAYYVDVGGHVLAACGAGGRIKAEKFNGGADDGVVGEARREHTVDEVGERRDAVHEDPEAWESGGTGEDTGRLVSDGS